MIYHIIMKQTCPMQILEDHGQFQGLLLIWFRASTGQAGAKQGQLGPDSLAAIKNTVVQDFAEQFALNRNKISPHGPINPGRCFPEKIH
jgi:hypothetical protein